MREPVREPPREVRAIIDEGREKTPQAWAFNNAQLLAKAFPTILDSLRANEPILDEEEKSLLEQLEKIR